MVDNLRLAIKNNSTKIDELRKQIVFLRKKEIYPPFEFLAKRKQY